MMNDTEHMNTHLARAIDVDTYLRVDPEAPSSAQTPKERFDRSVRLARAEAAQRSADALEEILTLLRPLAKRAQAEIEDRDTDTPSESHDGPPGADELMALAQAVQVPVLDIPMRDDDRDRATPKPVSAFGGTTEADVLEGLKRMKNPVVPIRRARPEHAAGPRLWQCPKCPVPDAVQCHSIEAAPSDDPELCTCGLPCDCDCHGGAS